MTNVKRADLVSILQSFEKFGVQVELGEDLVDMDMARYIRPPITRTAKLQSVSASGMSSPPTLHCESEAGHDRALSVP